MPYANRATQILAQNRSEKRLAHVPVREPLGPIQINSPRQALRAIADAVNRVRADPTIDQLTVSRLQIDAAKIANFIIGSQLDEKLDALAAQVAALSNTQDGADPKMPPLALPPAPPGDAVDATFVHTPPKNKGGRPRKDGNPPGWRPTFEPLGGIDPDRPAPAPAPPKNKGGRPRKDGNPPGWRPPVVPFVPTSAQMSDAIEQFVERADEDDVISEAAPTARANGDE